MNVVIYTKSGCVNCDRAKQLLKSKRLSAQEIDIEQDKAAASDLVRDHPSARQMPQIFIDGQRVGGLAGLQAALKQVGL